MTTRYMGVAVPGDDVEDLEEVVCALCQRFTSQALNYLASNKTQTEIILLLHNTCSQVWPMKAKVLNYFLSSHL